MRLERLPGHLGKNRPGLFGGQGKQSAAVFILPHVSLGRGNGFELLAQASVAAAGRLVFLSAQPVAHPAMDQREQPAAKGAPIRIVVEAFDGPVYRLENILRQVGSVSVLQSLAAGKTVNDGSVKSHKLPPG